MKLASSKACLIVRCLLVFQDDVDGLDTTESLAKSPRQRRWVSMVTHLLYNKTGVIYSLAESDSQIITFHSVWCGLFYQYFYSKISVIYGVAFDIVHLDIICNHLILVFNGLTFFFSPHLLKV